MTSSASVSPPWRPAPHRRRYGRSVPRSPGGRSDRRPRWQSLHHWLSTWGAAWARRPSNGTPPGHCPPRRCRSVEETDVLQLDLIAIDTGDLGDMRHDASPVAQPGLLHQQGDAADDLFTDGLERQVGATHDDHGLDPVDRILWTVGVHRGHASIVASVYRLDDCR